MKQYPTLTKFKTIDDLGKSYAELEKSGTGKLSLPVADAKPEEWDAFYGKIGRPEKADQYGLERPKFEGVKFDYPEALEKSFVDAAHKAGLSKPQAQALLNWWGNQQTEQMQAATKIFDTQQDALKKDWGANWETNLKGAQAGFKTYVLDAKNPELAELLKSTGMDTHPGVLKLFKALNDLNNEGGGMENNDNAGAGKEEQGIRDEINAERDRFYKLTAVQRTAQARAHTDKMEGLYKKLYGNKLA